MFNVVHGDKTAVDALLDHPDVAAVSFVGSTPIAKYIYETGTANGKRVQALGGAKNHAIILPDAGIDYASDHLVAAAFGSAGERCMAISAAVAVGGAADELIAAVSEKARAVKVGPGREADSEMGPVVTAAARDRIVGLIGTGAEQGAELAVDGRGLTVARPRERLLRRPDGHRRGHARRWTSTARRSSARCSSVVRADTVDEAIKLINSNPYGNGTAIFTSSGEAARRFQRGVNVGMIGINVPIPVPMAYYSFGGWKDSLFGQSHIHGPGGRRLLHPGQGRHLALAARRGARAAPASTSPRRTDTSSDDHVSIVCDAVRIAPNVFVLTPRGNARGEHETPAPGPDLIRRRSPHHRAVPRRTPQSASWPAARREERSMRIDRSRRSLRVLAVVAAASAALAACSSQGGAPASSGRRQQRRWRHQRQQPDDPDDHPRAGG